MPSQVTNYQCPKCNGPLHYSAASEKLECEYCGSAYEPDEIEKVYTDKNNSAASSKENADQNHYDAPWAAEGMRAYSCPDCGAELISDDTTAASSCPYCGNPSIVPGQFAGGLKPDFILPFRIEKKEAERALQKHYKGRPFLPGAFTSENHIHKVQGIYVPFRLFDAGLQGTACYDAYITNQYRSGDTEITERKIYDVSRSGTISFEKVPVDASRKMDDACMDSLEPYDYKDLKEFSFAYLPGYLADRYDVSKEDSMKRADLRCQNTFAEELKKTVSGYQGCVETGRNFHTQIEQSYYALLPVWVLHTKWNGKDYLFMMNGQTGKMTGDLPVSSARFWAAFAVFSAIISAVLSAVFMTGG